MDVAKLSPLTITWPSIMQIAPVRRAQGFGVATLALAFLAGCSTPSQPKPDEAKVRQFAGQGYLTDEQYGIATSFATWTTAKGSVDVALTIPARAGPFPLVVYLPSLGETRLAGEAWRKAWAQGGYAVLAFQPLAEDLKAWTAASARSGDFRPLARERYAGPAMSARLEALAGVLAELIRRQAQKEAALERIDLTHVAVAGFDLGAYTAMAIAGEEVPGSARPVLPLPVAAVIALSPYADFSGPSFATRYGAIRGPVLCVSGDNDADALGLVSSPSLRKAPFQYMPAGDKYLVTMANLQHSALSGGNLDPVPPEEGRSVETGDASERPQGSGRRGGKHKSAAAGAGMRSALSGAPPSPTAQAIGVAAVQGIAVAFLDAYLKQDPIAREWLEKDAARWLRNGGEIKRK